MFVFGLCMIMAQTAWAQDRWLHLSGISWHASPGYNGHNNGIGIEFKLEPRWSAAAGVFQNSLYRDSVYVLGKYLWIEQSKWKVNINIGAATGYAWGQVMPVAIPETCYGWVCVLITPKISSDTTSAAALYLRIPY